MSTEVRRQFKLDAGACLHLNVGGYDLTWVATQELSIVSGPQVVQAIDSLVAIGALVKKEEAPKRGLLRRLWDGFLIKSPT